MALPVVPCTLEKKTPGGKGFPAKELLAPGPAQNPAFLQSPAGRTARLVCELEEFPRRMGTLGVRGTFLVFGSARTKYGWQIDEQIAAQMAVIEKEEQKKRGDPKDEKVIAAAKAKIKGLEGLRWAAEWMLKTEELCRKLTEWALTPTGRRVGMLCKSNLLPHDTTASMSTALITEGVHNAPNRWYKGYRPSIAAAAAGDVTVTPTEKVPIRSRSAVFPAGVNSSSSSTTSQQLTNTLAYTFEQPLIVCSGGGPGFMEAANKGSYEGGGVSMGVGITLPFETRLNDYVTPGLHFNTDYFFTRKFWEVFSAKCMICCPGGMGTCDEMFEVLTLMQCGHCQDMPVVLLGKKFWTESINFNKLAEYNMISKYEIDALCITDSVDEAFDFIVNFLVKEAASEEKALLGGAKAGAKL